VGNEPQNQENCRISLYGCENRRDNLSAAVFLKKIYNAAEFIVLRQISG
jgi:hypothetical protein